jgi:cytochrome c oxidase subunit 2
MKRNVSLLAGIAFVIAVSAGASSALAENPVHVVQVVAKKFTFEPAVIQVTAGEPVLLVIRSADAAHGFAIRELNLDLQIPRGGEAVTAGFVAPPPGRYEVSCSEFCGSGHGQMKAALVSVAAAPTSRQ